MGIFGQDGYNSPRGWMFTKHASNPLVAKQYASSPYVISGKYRLYYAAHTTTTYTGVMCLAETNYIP